MECKPWGVNGCPWESELAPFPSQGALKIIGRQNWDLGIDILQGIATVCCSGLSDSLCATITCQIWDGTPVLNTSMRRLPMDI